MKFLVIFLFLSISSCISTNNKPYESEIAGKYHQVKPKENIDSIARKYRVNADELMDVNGIENPRHLRVGMNLFVPDPDPIGTKISQYIRRKNIKPKQEQSSKKPSKSSKKTAEPKQLAAKNTRNSRKIFAFPAIRGQIIRNYSQNKKSPYDGLAIKGTLGTKILASLGGKVIFVGDDGTRYGLLIIIEHQEPYITVYTHLSSALVTTGQVVRQGQSIGTMGQSGGLSFPQLHFQIRVNEKPVDPKLYLKTS